MKKGVTEVMSTEHSFILKLSCADRPGIVHAVSGFLFERGSNILDSAQFGDSRTGEFFMRVHFQQVGGDPGQDVLRTSFATLAEQFGMRWELHDASVKPRVVIMVSKIGHCLNDLLFRYHRSIGYRDSGDHLEPQGVLSTRGQLRHSVPSLPAD